MKKSHTSMFDTDRSRYKARSSGFTLMEVILVMVLIVIISGISLPYFAGSFRGSQLRSAARAVERITKYARSMAIMREQTMTVVLNNETMELFVGGEQLAPPTDTADGELDQTALKNLGYVDGGEDSSSSTGAIDKEVNYRLASTLTVKSFDKDWTEDDDEHPELHMIRFFPNGQCEWFKMELEDSKGDGVRLEINPISAKMKSELLQ